MKTSAAEKLIKDELYQLGVQSGSAAYKFIFDQAINASDILSRKELIALINDHNDTLPHSMFERE